VKFFDNGWRILGFILIRLITISAFLRKKFRRYKMLSVLKKTSFPMLNVKKKNSTHVTL